MKLLILLLSINMCALAYPQSQTGNAIPAAHEAKLRQELARTVAARLRTETVQSRDDAREAAEKFAQYVRERTGLRISKSVVEDLAVAEWRARSAGRATVSVEEFARVTNTLFLKELGESRVPTSGPSSSPYYLVTAEKLNAARQYYRRNLSDVTRSDLGETLSELNPARSQDRAVQFAYPIEAFLALYMCVTDDMGRDEVELWAKRSSERGSSDLTPPHGRKPYGDYGYLVQRPISKLWAENALSEILQVAR